jgi:hypothetical protein
MKDNKLTNIMSFIEHYLHHKKYNQLPKYHSLYNLNKMDDIECYSKSCVREKIRN